MDKEMQQECQNCKKLGSEIIDFRTLIRLYKKRYALLHSQFAGMLVDLDEEVKARRREAENYQRKLMFLREELRDTETDLRDEKKKKEILIKYIDELHETIKDIRKRYEYCYNLKDQIDMWINKIKQGKK